MATAAAGGDAASMVAVGLVWGATNALMRRGPLVWDRRSRSRSLPAGSGAVRRWADLLLTWQYSAPFLANLSASSATPPSPSLCPSPTPQPSQLPPSPPPSSARTPAPRPPLSALRSSSSAFGSILECSVSSNGVIYLFFFFGKWGDIPGYSYSTAYTIVAMIWKDLPSMTRTACLILRRYLCRCERNGAVWLE